MCAKHFEVPNPFSVAFFKNLPLWVFWCFSLQNRLYVFYVNSSFFVWHPFFLGFLFSFPLFVSTFLGFGSLFGFYFRANSTFLRGLEHPEMIFDHFRDEKTRFPVIFQSLGQLLWQFKLLVSWDRVEKLMTMWRLSLWTSHDNVL